MEPHVHTDVWHPFMFSTMLTKEHSAVCIVCIMFFFYFLLGMQQIYARFIHYLKMKSILHVTEWCNTYSFFQILMSLSYMNTFFISKKNSILVLLVDVSCYILFINNYFLTILHFLTFISQANCYSHHLSLCITAGTWVCQNGICKCTARMQCCWWKRENTCIWSH